MQQWKYILQCGCKVCMYISIYTKFYNSLYNNTPGGGVSGGQLLHNQEGCCLCQSSVSPPNYLWTTKFSVNCPPRFTNGQDREQNPIEGGWRTDEEPGTGMQSLSRICSNRWVLLFGIDYYVTMTLFYRYWRSAVFVLDQFRDCFVTPAGEVSWQYVHVCRTHYIHMLCGIYK